MLLQRFFSKSQKFLRFRQIAKQYPGLQVQSFSSFAKLPQVDKTVRMPETKGFFGSSLFKESYLSKPAYLLAKELFEYILESQYLQEEFPIVKENEEIYINFMVLHVILLNFRLNQEESSYALKEASIFQYYCKTNFFVDFATKLNEHMPVDDFANDFIENYARRMEIYSQDLEDILSKDKNKKDQIFKETEMKRLKEFLRKNIFMYEISDKDQYLEKLLKYVLAHRNYLMSLTYQELTTYKVFWGFTQDTFLLENLSNPENE